MTVLHNGVLVQDHAEIKGTTPDIGWPKNPPHGIGPLRLQDHGDNSRVGYRNLADSEIRVGEGLSRKGQLLSKALYKKAKGRFCP